MPIAASCARPLEKKLHSDHSSYLARSTADMASFVRSPNEILELIAQELDFETLQALSRTCRRLWHYFERDFRELCRQNFIYRKRGESWNHAFRRAPYRVFFPKTPKNDFLLPCPSMGRILSGKCAAPHCAGKKPSPSLAVNLPTGMVAALRGDHVEVRNLDQNERLKVSIRAQGRIRRAEFVADGKRLIIQKSLGHHDEDTHQFQFTSICTHTWKALVEEQLPCRMGMDNGCNILYDSVNLVLYNLRRDYAVEVEPKLDFLIQQHPYYDPHGIAGAPTVVVPVYDYYSDTAEYVCFECLQFFLVFDYGKDSWTILQCEQREPSDYGADYRVDAKTGQIVHYLHSSMAWCVTRISDKVSLELEVPDVQSCYLLFGQGERLFMDHCARKLACYNDGKWTKGICHNPFPSHDKWDFPAWRVPERINFNERCLIAMKSRLGKHIVSVYDKNVASDYAQIESSLIRYNDLDQYTGVVLIDETRNWYNCVLSPETCAYMDLSLKVCLLRLRLRILCLRRNVADLTASPRRCCLIVTILFFVFSLVYLFFKYHY